MTEELKNLLVIKPSALGDIVLALPTLAALRTSLPSAKISWLVRTEFAALLENHPHLDEIILFDRKLLGRAWRDPKAFSALSTLIRRLRDSRFDAVFDLQGLFRTACLAWLSRCPKRFGMAEAREFGHLFYNHKVAQDAACIHLVDYYLKIAEAAGVSKTDVQFVFPEDASAAESVENLLREHNIPIDNYVVLVPGSARENKRWPVERFACLADNIASNFACSIVIVGSCSEKGLAERLKALTKTAVTNLASRTSIADLVPLLKSARLVVGNDTGPGHIAAALGVPIVLIFGPTNPSRVAPYGRGQCVVAIDPFTRGLKPDSCDPKHNIKNITVDMVFEKVASQLKGGSAAAHH